MSFRNILIVMILPALLWAGKITSFTIQTDKNRVNEGGVATVTAVLLTNKTVQVSIPSFPKSEVYQVVGSTQRQSSSSSVQIINGRRTAERRVENRFYYKIIFPKSGKVTLPGLKVDIDGEKAQTKPIVFTVGANVEKEQAPVSVEFVRPKSTLYLNEQIPFTLRFLQRMGGNGSLTGTGVNEVYRNLLEKLGTKFAVTNTQETYEQSTKSINGIQYEVVELDFSLTAIDTGTLVVPPMVLSYMERKTVQDRDQFGFASSFFASTTTVDASTTTPRLTLRIKPHPPAPAGYTGIVGRVTLRGQVSEDTVKVGEGLTVKYTLSGKMKSNDLGEVKLPKLNDFEQFTPEKRTWADSSDGTITTKKTISYMMIPRQAGDFTIPEVKVIWFDPITGAYKAETAGPFSVTVLPGDGTVKPAKRYLTKEQIATVGSDIRYIKTVLPEKGEVLKPYRSMLAIVLIPIPYLLILLLVLYKLSVKLMPNDEDVQIRKGALGKAFKELDRIAKGKSSGSPANEVEQYLLKKYGISAPSMRRDELKSEVLKRGASEESASALLSFLDAVEMSRYSGKSSGESLVNEAKQVLKQITREVK